MELKKIFDNWAGEAHQKYEDKQWLLSKWEVYEGIAWPQEKTDTLIRMLVEGLQLNKNHHLIELGCGGGWILKSLQAFCAKSYALDFSQDMLKAALRLLGQDCLLCAEIGALPLKSKSFDRVLCYYVFMNFDDDDYLNRSLLEIFRILKPGGRALIGQLPLKTGSARYEQAKAAYFDYCREHYNIGKSIRQENKPPLRLFDKDTLAGFLESRGVCFSFRNSFNPFYRKGQSASVDWRFDLVLEK